MTMIKIRFLVVLLFSLSVLKSQTLTKHWDARFGGNTNTFHVQSIVNGDGSSTFFGHTAAGIGGTINSAPRGQSDAWVVKVDSNGNYLWQKRYGGAGQEELRDALLCKDGGYLILMDSYSGTEYEKSENTRGSSDVWLLKVDGSGNKLWDKTYGGAKTDYPFTATELPDGNFLIVCASSSPMGFDVTDSMQGWKLWLLKTTPTGQKIWDKKLANSNPSYGGFRASILPTGSGTYKVAYNDATGVAGGNFSFIEIDTAGNLLSNTLLDAGGTVSFSSMVKTFDGNYVLVGSSGFETGTYKKNPPIGTNGTEDYWAVKVSPTGSYIWDKVFGGIKNDYGYDIAETTDSGLMVVGMSESGVTGGNKTIPSMNNSYDGWLLKLDKDGNIKYQWAYRGNYDDGFNRISYIDDDHIYISGLVGSLQGGDVSKPYIGPSDYLMVKYSENPARDTTTSPIGIRGIISQSHTVYPNPASKKLFVQNNDKTIIKVELLNLLGEKVIFSPFLHDETNIELDISDFSEGVYMLSCYFNNGEHSFQRVIISR